MSTKKFTVQIEAGSADETIWQALHPSEAATGESAEEVARDTAQNQNIVDDDGLWRVLVWEGADADTNTEPAYELRSDD